jgi:hypothetical protein
VAVDPTARATAESSIPWGGGGHIVGSDPPGGGSHRRIYLIYMFI